MIFRIAQLELTIGCELESYSVHQHESKSFAISEVQHTCGVCSERALCPLRAGRYNLALHNETFLESIATITHRERRAHTLVHAKVPCKFDGVFRLQKVTSIRH
jgi:hypothetical protein